MSKSKTPRNRECYRWHALTQLGLAFTPPNVPTLIVFVSKGSGTWHGYSSAHSSVTTARHAALAVLTFPKG